MRAVRRLTDGDPAFIADAGLGIGAAGLTAIAAWGPAGLVGTAIVGPPWLLGLLPLLMGAPLLLRRRAPLLMWAVIWAGLGLQDLITDKPPRGLEFMFVLFTAAYSLGAYAGLARAATGLVVAFPAMAEITDKGGLLNFTRHRGGEAVALSSLQLLAFWLTGVVVRARRQAAVDVARSAALQRQAEQAAAAERARIAWELHDIVAHHLSVIVLQAAGARASGKPAAGDPKTLEKIENSGRQALTETRRLLGVLRDPDEETGFAPQPRLGELDGLAASVRAAGLPVNLAVSGDLGALPAAVEVSAYRIVQEALTNVLKHAGPARADVTVGCAENSVTIEVTDNGTGEPGHLTSAGGHGLAGMRERAALLGGELAAGPRADGGFAVRARLPLSGEPPDQPS
ncbi:MAG: histidine kinase [Streptosporangiaceae bacterium]|jgi:signal transduction histidine kinase